MEILSGWLREHLSGRLPMAIGHRVVHGGPDFDRPVLIDDAVLDGLERFVALAPLHQPNNLAPIRAIRARMPDMPQVACFDTAFHRTHDELVERYAIPEWLRDEGVRRYGFHGLSYEYIAEALADVAPDRTRGRVVAAHLGSGASLCAMQDGHSVDSTMGFTALDAAANERNETEISRPDTRPAVYVIPTDEERMIAKHTLHILQTDTTARSMGGRHMSLEHG